MRSERLNAIGVKQWRTNITNRIDKIQTCSTFDRHECLASIRTKIATDEGEYHKLREVTAILELALWKAKMNDISQGKRRRSSKRMKLDGLDLRKQCHIRCGANSSHFGLPQHMQVKDGTLCLFYLVHSASPQFIPFNHRL